MQRCNKQKWRKVLCVCGKKWSQIIRQIDQDESALDSIKTGEWIEVDEYSLSNLITFVGNYKNKQKVGLWNEMMRNKEEISQDLLKFIGKKYSMKKIEEVNALHDNFIQLQIKLIIILLFVLIHFILLSLLE